MSLSLYTDQSIQDKSKSALINLTDSKAIPNTKYNSDHNDENFINEIESDLKKMKPSQKQHFLVNLLKHQHRYIRKYAADRLGNIGDNLVQSHLFFCIF